MEYKGIPINKGGMNARGHRTFRTERILRTYIWLGFHKKQSAEAEPQPIIKLSDQGISIGDGEETENFLFSRGDRKLPVPTTVCLSSLPCISSSHPHILSSFF